MNRTQQKCSNFHPEARMLPAYIQCWPFDAGVCEACGDVGVDWGPIKTFVFDILIGWWWNGAVLVRDVGAPPSGAVPNPKDNQ